MSTSLADGYTDETGSPTALEAALLTYGWQPLADELRAQAYESLSPPMRARLKTTLALNRAVYGEADGVCVTQCVNPRLGFSYRCQTQPAQWVLVVTNATFGRNPDGNDASRMAAALMCARLAGVGEIIALWPDAPPSGCLPELVTALELTGVESVFAKAEPASPVQLTSNACEPETDWEPVLRELTSLLPSGRIVYFGPSPMPTQLMRAASIHRLPVWTNEDLGDEGIANENDTQNEPALPSSPRGLRLGPGCEHCWLHPNLGPDFFLDRSYTLSATP